MSTGRNHGNTQTAAVVCNQSVVERWHCCLWEQRGQCVLSEIPKMDARMRACHPCIDGDGTVCGILMEQERTPFWWWLDEFHCSLWEQLIGTWKAIEAARGSSSCRIYTKSWYFFIPHSFLYSFWHQPLNQSQCFFFAADVFAHFLRRLHHFIGGGAFTILL